MHNNAVTGQGSGGAAVGGGPNCGVSEVVGDKSRRRVARGDGGGWEALISRGHVVTGRRMLRLRRPVLSGVLLTMERLCFYVGQDTDDPHVLLCLRLTEMAG